MTPAEIDLYDRINKFPLDLPGVAMPFSVKLAWEYRWEQTYTIRAIQEYKKFIFIDVNCYWLMPRPHYWLKQFLARILPDN
jgi:hypothetical protein